MAKILNDEDTKELVRMDDALAKKPNSSSDAPLFAYVVLTTSDFDGRAAHLMNSGGRVENKDTENKDDFSIFGELNSDDIASLKKRILEGLGISPRLVKLVKDLG